MQTEDSQKVIKRFFEALYYLKDMKIIRGKQTFTNEFGINRWNLNTLEKDMSRDIFQVSWLTYLVQKYGVSSTWLLTGRGEILAFNKDKKKEGIPTGSRGIAKHLTAHKENAHVYDVGIHHCF